ncbi:MAG: hypothetical protein HRU26_12175 [Psychroserpens sp.]|nr:hypothetical protein [Psychroserpens sp.]
MLTQECKYTIDTFSYKPVKRVKSIEERKKAFQDKLKNWSRYNDIDFKLYPKWLRKDFFEYWTEFANDNGRKMRFEMEKTWNTGRRLATAKKTIYSKDPRWKTDVKQVYVAPKQKNIDYGRIDPEKAKERLREQSKSKIMGAGDRVKRNWL